MKIFITTNAELAAVFSLIGIEQTRLDRGLSGCYTFVYKTDEAGLAEFEELQALFYSGRSMVPARRYIAAYKNIIKTLKNAQAK